MEKNKLEEVADRMMATDIRKAKENINEVYNEIVVENKPDHGELPESVFKDHFLDYFKNIEKAEDDTKLLKWIEVSGGPYNPTDLIDNNGDVVLTVPPIYGKPDVDDEALSNLQMHDVVAKFTNKASVLYASGISYLTTELSSIPENISSNASKDISGWKQVINHYDKDNKKVNKDLPKHKAKILAPIDDDDLSYD